jgi:CRP-like cAMP-binding protein
VQCEAASKQIGQVVEISWRATKIRTQDCVDVVVPNGLLARTPILNFSRPTALSRRSVWLTTPHDVPSSQVRRSVLDAVVGCEGVLSDPSPSVVTHAFTSHGIEYWLRYFIVDFDRRDAIDGAVRDRVWLGLRRSGIALAVEAHRVDLRARTAESERESLERDVARRQTAFGRIELFRDLPAEAIEQLAAGAKLLPYGASEVVVRQGDRGDELFLCVEGELSVRHAASQTAEIRQDREIARLGPGGVFGELSLMTGAQRSASVVALVPCELLVIGKAALAPVLESQPLLAERLSGRLAERQAELEALAELEAAGSRTTLQERQGQLLVRIRQFFSLDR